ncbi:hypothetical protein BO86DRAFT_425483 [Aspergillus japonicus CBS 114.51]|uniref:Uncharacterized protein n=1 Tax=Aspergillus japonicus CBS 114.51 TaxID=1448312 RepID=A0A8T8WJY6_ASPJA|nr:hypothetical protein BO86DRAFT_425483 [Aspergillus japonicus CBS 114.51]RAH76188.1 hypothetical protein BO86DRAFT_425483 [Aspergillus japonicus CBS 114.51]
MEVREWEETAEGGPLTNWSYSWHLFVYQSGPHIPASVLDVSYQMPCQQVWDIMQAASDSTHFYIEVCVITTTQHINATTAVTAHHMHPPYKKRGTAPLNVLASIVLAGVPQIRCQYHPVQQLAHTVTSTNAETSHNCPTGRPAQHLSISSDSQRLEQHNNPPHHTSRALNQAPLQQAGPIAQLSRVRPPLGPSFCLLRILFCRFTVMGNLLYVADVFRSIEMGQEWWISRI